MGKRLAWVGLEICDSLDGRWVGGVDGDSLDMGCGMGSEVELGMGHSHSQGTQIGIEIGGRDSKALVGMADLNAVGIEDCSARGWLEVIVPVPVGLGTLGEDREVVGKGCTGMDSICPCFPFITMANPGVLEEVGQREIKLPGRGS